MNLKTFLLFLTLSSPVWSFSGRPLCPKIPVCGLCRLTAASTLISRFNYYCPEMSHSPNFEFSYSPNEDVSIKCLLNGTLETFLSWLPSGVENLSNSKKLRIEDCPINANFSIGEFAEKIGMQQVVELFLVNVEFTKTLKKKNFEGLTDLFVLGLDRLNIQYVEQDLLEYTPNLKVLSLLSNQVNVSSEFFRRVPKLSWLELGNNNIHAIEPDTFEPLQYLEALSIGANNISRIDEHTFGNLSQLSALDFSSNPVTEITTGALSQLRNLTTVQATRLKISKFPEDLFRNNEMLKDVGFFNNEVTMEELPSGMFANLQKLNSVTVTGFGLKRLPADLFSESKNIEQIDLKINEIEELPTTIFHNLQFLEKLILSENKLTDIPEYLFRDLVKLKHLDLARNNFHVIRNNYFVGMPALEKISLKENELNKIESEAFSLVQSLRDIDLSYNNLTRFNNISQSQSPFSSCIKLQYIKLSHNKLTKIYSDWLFVLLHLKELDLEHNNITILNTEDFKFLSSKVKVNLRNNKIERISLNLNTLESLVSDEVHTKDVVIDLSENNNIICDCHFYAFKQFLEGKVLQEASKLFKLVTESVTCLVDDKSYNIYDVNSEDLVCKKVNTENNTVCPHLCDCEFSSKNNAILVNCDNKGLTEAPPILYNIDNANKTIYLNLQNNRLKKLPSKNQENYHLVEKMYVNYNQIDSFKPENILPALTELDLSHNNLTMIESATLKKVVSGKKITSLKLNNNPWSCQCEAHDFLIFIQSHYNIIQDPSSVICSEVSKPFVNLTINDICETSEVIMITTIVFSAIVMFLAFIAALYFRYHNEIKIWLYAHQCCLGLITEDDLDKDKPYDAFISYSHKDEHFVVNELVRKLESGPQPYKLCLHYRDWMAGDLIPSQIARSVEDSKRTIIVLSKNFLTSVWGTMEFRAAHRQALNEGRARVIVVIYGEVPTDNELDTELKAYLNMNTYVQWGDKWFWDKLRYAMPHGPRIRGLKKAKKVGNNELVNMNVGPILGPTNSSMPTVSIVSNKLVDKNEANDLNDKVNTLSKEVLLKATADEQDMLQGIFNSEVVKKDEKDDDTVNEDDGGFNNRALYRNMMLNLNNSHSTMV